MNGILPSGHVYKELKGEELEKLKQRYAAYVNGAIVANPGNFTFPKKFLKFAELFRYFEIRETDTFVVAVYKSGTHFAQEIVWYLLHNPDLDNPEADLTTDLRSPFLEMEKFTSHINHDFNPKGAFRDIFDKLCPGMDIKDGFLYNLAKSWPDPRIIKSHMPLSFLPQDIFTKAKIVYLARDPRDIIVSGYSFIKSRKAFINVTIDDFVDDFINGKVFRSYWEHVKLGWERRNEPNVLFLFYEDLKADPKSQIKRMDQFLGTNRTDKQIENVVSCTSFDYMKEKMKFNPPTSFDNEFYSGEVEKGKGFFRKGKVGSWKEDLPLHLHEKVNAWMDKNLAQFDDDFKYKSK